MKNVGDRLKRYSHKGSVVIQLLAIGGFLCLLGVSQNASATNYFNWGVESLKVDYGVNGPGQYTVAAFGGTTRDCTVAHTGLCSSKLVVYGNDNGNQSQGWDLIQWNPTYPWNFVGSPALYYRWWMKIQPGFKWGSPEIANVKTSRVLGETAVRGYTGHMRSSGFYIAECETVGSAQPGGGCLTTSGVSNNDYNIRIPYDMTKMADGTWHEYIVRVKPNTTATVSNAEFKVWVDGVVVGELLGWRLHNINNNKMSEAWGGWMVTPYFQMNGTASDGGTIYVDDFSTDDTYNSFIGGGGTTPLSPPDNLRIN